MPNTTLTGATTALFDLLSNDDDGNPVQSLGDAGVVKVYPMEPGATGVAFPCSVTIQFAGWTPTDWVFNVRIYVADLHPLIAQDLIEAAYTAVDAALKAGAFVGPSAGDVQWVEEIKTWVAGGPVMIGREDGF
jgi:hypothetical protein